MLNVSNSTDHHFYNYTPSRRAPLVFGWLNIVTTGLMIIAVLSCAFTKFRQVRNWHKTDLELRFFSVTKLIGAYFPLIIGMALETLGYAGRSISSVDQQVVGPYVLQVLLLLVAPTLYAATIYMLFGRLTHLLFAEQILILPARFNTVFFVLGDIISLVMQTAGSSMRADSSSAQTGTNIASAGLYIQLIFFGLFIANEVLFYFRINTIPSNIPNRFKLWKYSNFILLFTSGLILIRSIVRTIEFKQGDNGFITDHEWCLYVFDSALMFTVGLIFLVSLPFFGLFQLQVASVEAQIDDAHDVKNRIVPVDYLNNMNQPINSFELNNIDESINLDDINSFRHGIDLKTDERF